MGCEPTLGIPLSSVPSYSVPSLPSHVSSPNGSEAEPQPKLNLVHFSLKIWHLVATNLKIFRIIKFNQLTKFLAKCPNFVQNLETRV